MALFKVYHGDKDDLPSELKDSYGYLVVDENAEAGTWTDDQNQEHTYGIGEWYVDAGDTGYEKRYRIAAAQLIDDEGNLVTIDDLTMKDDFADDLVDAVWDSEQEESKLIATDQAAIRNSIGVADENDSITRAYTATISYSDWEQDSNNFQLYYNVITLNEPLHCGKADSLTPVPPMILWNRNGVRDGFDVLLDAKVNDAKTTITFYVSANNLNIVQANNIGIVIIDYR